MKKDIEQVREEFLGEFKNYTSGEYGDALSRSEHFAYEILPTIRAAVGIFRAEPMAHAAPMDITYEIFVHPTKGWFEFVVIKWNKFGYCPINTHMNSFHANVRAIAEHLDGGHYDNLEFYNQLVKESTIHAVFSAKEVF